MVLWLSCFVFEIFWQFIARLWLCYPTAYWFKDSLIENYSANTVFNLLFCPTMSLVPGAHLQQLMVKDLKIELKPSRYTFICRVFTKDLSYILHNLQAKSICLCICVCMCNHRKGKGKESMISKLIKIRKTFCLLTGYLGWK